MLKAITHHLARLVGNQSDCVAEIENDREELQKRIEKLEERVRVLQDCAIEHAEIDRLKEQIEALEVDTENIREGRTV